ncbi:GNAT family N-acetyltransferase [Oceanitalea stevensii]|uniref:GNAT family N-acetyltransferase n=1 Tax=Oceanitalea stevensii TaxID=2763072 RepID=A0ABR8Z1A0_9MICO|nr:GNAT family N-acetyltransferase [Oceanitalea stevensii]MBD8061813.1 GNAT family N-acetyltransferase [Oceanitalea stevensii]
MGATAGRARRAAGVPPVRVLEGQAGSDAAAHAVRSYLAELSHRLDIDPSFADAADPAEVTPPRGDFMLLSEIATGTVVGFGAVHVLEPGVVEIRRMWLKPDVRGRGLGRFLLGSLENRARSLGGRRVLLGVNESLVEACGLYRASGYEPVERDEDNPYVTHVFGKVLVESLQDAST